MIGGCMHVRMYARDERKVVKVSGSSPKQSFRLEFTFKHPALYTLSSLNKDINIYF